MKRTGKLPNLRHKSRSERRKYVVNATEETSYTSQFSVSASNFSELSYRSTAKKSGGLKREKHKKDDDNVESLVLKNYNRFLTMDESCGFYVENYLEHFKEKNYIQSMGSKKDDIYDNMSYVSTTEAREMSIADSLYHAHLNKQIGATNLFRGKRVLMVGCGSHINLHYYLRHGHGHFLFVDINKDEIEMAKTRIDEFNSQSQSDGSYEFMTYDINDLVDIIQNEKDKFDVIIATKCLGQVVKDYMTVSEMIKHWVNDLLTSNGIMIVDELTALCGRRVGTSNVRLFDLYENNEMSEFGYRIASFNGKFNDKIYSIDEICAENDLTIDAQYVFRDQYGENIMRHQEWKTSIVRPRHKVNRDEVKITELFEEPPIKSVIMENTFNEHQTDSKMLDFFFRLKPFDHNGMKLFPNEDRRGAYELSVLLPKWDGITALLFVTKMNSLIITPHGMHELGGLNLGEKKKNLILIGELVKNQLDVRQNVFVVTGVVLYNGQRCDPTDFDLLMILQKRYCKMLAEIGVIFTSEQMVDRIKNENGNDLLEIFVDQGKVTNKFFAPIDGIVVVSDGRNDSFFKTLKGYSIDVKKKEEDVVVKAQLTTLIQMSINNQHTMSYETVYEVEPVVGYSSKKHDQIMEIRYDIKKKRDDKARGNNEYQMNNNLISAKNIFINAHSWPDTVCGLRDYLRLNVIFMDLED